MMISGKAGSNLPTIQPITPPNVSDNHSNVLISIFTELYNYTIHAKTGCGFTEEKPGGTKDVREQGLATGHVNLYFIQKQCRPSRARLAASRQELS